LRRQDVLALWQKRRVGSPRLAERAVVTKPAKPYAKGAYQTRWPHRAKNGEGDEVEMAEKYRRRFPAHTNDRAACVAASYLMLRDLWNEALNAAAAGKECLTARQMRRERSDQS